MEHWNDKPLGLKTFLDELRQYCDGLSRQELIRTFIELGAETPSQERRVFLRHIAELAEGRVEPADPSHIHASAERLAEQVRARWQSIEDMTYWQDYAPQEEDDPFYDGDFPPAVTSSQREELLALLSDVGALFLEGWLSQARSAYPTLLGLFDEGSPEDHHISFLETPTELFEARTRYVRCIYFLEPAASRTRAVFDAMHVHEGESTAWRETRPDLPTLDDVRNAGPEELDDFDSFVDEWKETLRLEALESERGRRLYLEAVELTEGLSAVGAIAREWAGRHLTGYEYWIKRLCESEQWGSVLACSREVLHPGVTESPLVRGHRTFFIRALASAGRALGDREVFLEAMREAFRHRPSDDTLTELLLAAERAQRRDAELSEAIDYLSRSERPNSLLYVEALLIGGRLGETLQIARSTQSVGWRTGESAGALCFAAILAYRARTSLDHCPTIRRLLSQHVSQTWSSSSRFISIDPDEEDDESSALPAGVEAEKGDKAGHRGVGSESRVYERFDTRTFLARAVREGVTASRLSSETEQAYITWAETIGRRRVDHIVSNKHRGAYARAAQVVVALAELRLAAGNAGEAHELIASYRQTYKRHSAFHRHLSTVLEWSPLGGIRL